MFNLQKVKPNVLGYYLFEKIISIALDNFCLLTIFYIKKKELQIQILINTNLNTLIFGKI